MSDFPVFNSSLIDHTDLERYRNKAGAAPSDAGHPAPAPRGSMPNSLGIQSAHVIMVPWCQCCAARVPIDHICECEKDSQAEWRSWQMMRKEYSCDLCHEKRPPEALTWSEFPRSIPIHLGRGAFGPDGTHICSDVHRTIARPIKCRLYSQRRGSQMTFARGAKRSGKLLDQELTIIEASFVTMSIAERQGMSREQWLAFAAKAWDNFSRRALSLMPVQIND